MSSYEFSQLPLSEQLSLMSRLNEIILDLLEDATVAPSQPPQMVAIREQLDSAIIRSQALMGRANTSLYSQN